ncbi:MFS transporter [Spirochaeta isovalerica]|uniref:MFS family permease n=1 Tax=Spirochaeta isovalerica TaxID=150 RepID=A0A841RI62_9SPIO|nr:MFS transporter [Spirochaeta isovalerica]MBB6481992.1 MFS family permease [Spirochaeta isovalerica]
MSIETNKTISSLHRHVFLGNFDQGVIFIFLSFLVWNKTESMLTVALAFIIPAIVNTVIDYYFSSLSDKVHRVKLIIIGNIGSAIFLSCYGVFDSIYILYIFIFFKSLFAKIYQTSLTPYYREVIPEDNYKSFIAKINMYGTIGASIGGFTLIYLYIFTHNIPLIFIVSGLIELISTVFLFSLKNVKQKLKRDTESQIDITNLKKYTFIYSLEAFGIALIINRFVIFLNDAHNLKIQDVGVVFFIVYGVSNLIAVKVYKLFSSFAVKNMLITNFLIQAILLIAMMNINNLIVIITLWFTFELISNITTIYTDDHINKSLFTNIGKSLSKFRIFISISGILGQILIGAVWDIWGIGISFYLSGSILFILAIIIVFIKLHSETTFRATVDYE